jgi:hypothetical protein
MLSKEGYLNDGVHGPWHPHVMWFVAYDQMATCAAGFAGLPIIAAAAEFPAVPTGDPLDPGPPVVGRLDR